MESPLGPVIAGIFMAELEKSLISTFMEHMSPWKRYVDDTMAVKSYHHSCIKSYHQKLHMYCQFSTAFTKILNLDMSWNKMIRLIFLDAMLIRTNDTLQTKIYRKSTQNYMYLHWNSFRPRTWKRGALRTILIRVYKICSTKELLQNELKQIEK